MYIKCPDCMRKIDSANINIHTFLAKCTECNCVFNFKKELEKNRKNDDDTDEVLANIPKGLEVEENNGELNIMIKWFSKEYIGILVFCIAFNGLILIWEPDFVLKNITKSYMKISNLLTLLHLTI